MKLLSEEVALHGQIAEAEVRLQRLHEHAQRLQRWREDPTCRPFSAVQVLALLDAPEDKSVRAFRRWREQRRRRFETNKPQGASMLALEGDVHRCGLCGAEYELIAGPGWMRCPLDDAWLR